MSDDPAQRLAAANRLSIRAVLDTGQGDIQSALTKAGIFEPVAIPVWVGDDPRQQGGFLGDGITPNVTATLEPDEPDAFYSDQAFEPPPQPASQAEAAAPGTTTLPAAFGMRPMAPVRKPAT